jgi:hypothetical protein
MFALLPLACIAVHMASTSYGSAHANHQFMWMFPILSMHHLVTYLALCIALIQVFVVVVSCWFALWQIEFVYTDNPVKQAPMLKDFLALPSVKGQEPVKMDPAHILFSRLGKSMAPNHPLYCK